MDKEREIAIQQGREELRELLKKEGPKDSNQCTLFESSEGRFYLVTGGKTADDQMMFVINDCLWYDHTVDYMESKPWKVLYKKMG